MKKCKDIESRLPLYIEGSFSADEKMAVEEHLKSCTRCANVLAQLQKTEKMVNELTEVEPPLWFKQKIMAKVRGEAQKKSFAPKWFYPLRIKVPVQVFATIFIVVIAVYIYRAGNEQFKTVVLPQAPVPVINVEKDKLPGQSAKAPEADMSTVTKAKVADRKDMQNEKVVMSEVSSDAAAPKTQELKKEMPQENMRAGAADMTKAMKGDVYIEKKAETYASMPAKSAPSPSLEMERKKGYTLGASMKQSRALEEKSMMPMANISVRVGDLNAAVGEVERLLNKYEAKKIVKQMPEGKAIFTAEVKVKNIKDIIVQLKTIGRVEEKSIPADGAEGDVSVVIEILNN